MTIVEVETLLKLLAVMEREGMELILQERQDTERL
jgi:hypothetical protein